MAMSQPDQPAEPPKTMAEVILFHHALGLTPGVVAFADRLRSDGHVVHTPDLFDGRTFSAVADGVAYAQAVGFDTIINRGQTAATELPMSVVYAGMSLGVLPAQQLAQTRPGGLGAVFLEACVPLGEFGDAWPADVAVQVHGMDADPFFAGEGDIEAARHLVGQAANGELFTYPGGHHLFVDHTQPGYDADAANLVVDRVLGLLRRVETPTS